MSLLAAILLAVAATAPCLAAPVPAAAADGPPAAFWHTGPAVVAHSPLVRLSTVPWLGILGTVAPTPEAATGEPERPSVSLPVPAAIWMFGTGLAALGLARRRISAWQRRDRRRASTAAVAAVPVRGRRMLRRRLHAAVGERLDGEPVVAAGSGGDGGMAAQRKDDWRRGGSRDPDDAPARPQCDASLIAQRFAELAAALVEQPNVSQGRRFGMSCVKLGKRAFLAHDDGNLGGIAFRVGEHDAIRLLVELPQLEYWNPRQERQAKRSWVICRRGHGELLVRLALDAYEQALRAGSRPEQETMTSPDWQPEAT